MCHYDAKFRIHRQLCLSLLKRLGFGHRSVMETRILTETEEMINRVRAEQGRPFDMKQLATSCVANVIMNISFGCRFDHSDSTFQQYLSDMNIVFVNFSTLLEIFPALRFLPYFKNRLAKKFTATENCHKFVENNIAVCIEVCWSFSVLIRSLELLDWFIIHAF